MQSAVAFHDAWHTCVIEPHVRFFESYEHLFNKHREVLYRLYDDYYNTMGDVWRMFFGVADPDLYLEVKYAFWDTAMHYVYNRVWTAVDLCYGFACHNVYSDSSPVNDDILRIKRLMVDTVKSALGRDSFMYAFARDKLLAGHSIAKPEKIVFQFNELYSRKLRDARSAMKKLFEAYPDLNVPKTSLEDISLAFTCNMYECWVKELFVPCYLDLVEKLWEYYCELRDADFYPLYPDNVVRLTLEEQQEMRKSDLKFFERCMSKDISLVDILPEEEHKKRFCNRTFFALQTIAYDFLLVLRPRVCLLDSLGTARAF